MRNPINVRYEVPGEMYYEGILSYFCDAGGRQTNRPSSIFLDDQDLSAVRHAACGFHCPVDDLRVVRPEENTGSCRVRVHSQNTNSLK